MARSPAETLVSGQPVMLALQSLREDIDLIDEQVGQKPRLTPGEGLTLVASAALAAASPMFWSEKVVEVLIPGCALLTAAISVSAEYGGRVATANGKQVAAVSLRAAMESEALLASAERSKAVIPLTFGTSAAAAMLSLVVSPLLKELSAAGVVTPFRNELLLVCPIVAMFASAVAALAEVETAAWAEAARSLGRRRFATRGIVGRSWQSQTEMVYNKDSRERKRWISFIWGISPAPIAALSVGGDLGFKAVVATFFAAAQAAYYFAAAENAVSRATASVALKGRTAAVAETYASQAWRVQALLPFTSALASVCAAFAAIAVEVQPFASAVFPTLGALVAAAAQVAKACCEADASAALSAADTFGNRPAIAPVQSNDFDTERQIPLIPALVDLVRPIFGAKPTQDQSASLTPASLRPLPSGF